MRRPDPPPLAAWILEHCVPPGCDEAVAGDVLEDYRAGRSDGWYWRQAIGACVAGWVKYLDDRRALLVFAFLWSMLAPAWTTLLDAIADRAHHSNQPWQMDWPFSEASSVLIWFLLNLVFFWTGILLFLVCHPRFRWRSRLKDVRRALVLPAGLFLPIYFLTFAALNLLFFNHSMVDRQSITLLREIVDVRLWAVALRVPYLITMLAALWKITPRLSVVRLETAVLGPGTSNIGFSDFTTNTALDTYSAKRFFVLVVISGVVNVMIGGFLIFRLPGAYSPTLGSLIMRSFFYLTAAIIAGAMGSWLYWNNPTSPFRASAPIPFSMLALGSAAGWVWAPATILFSEQVSGATAFTAMIGVFALCIGVREIAASLFVPEEELLPSNLASPVLFGDSQLRPSFELKGYAIALALYGTGYALIAKSNWTAALLLALCAILLAIHRVIPSRLAIYPGYAYRRAALRLIAHGFAALVVTAWALLTGVHHRFELARVEAGMAAKPGTTHNASSAVGLGGYQSIILWPVPQKKQILAPLPERTELLAPGTTKPLVIRFNGAYWVMQSPERRPGKNAHQAHTSPLAVDIHANNSVPLVMEAHQQLGRPIRLAHCREVRMTVDNAEFAPAEISASIVVSDSTTKRTFSLGEQALTSREPVGMELTRSAHRETLRFQVPSHVTLRRFDEITVKIQPDMQHRLTAPKVGIVEFELVPR